MADLENMKKQELIDYTKNLISDVNKNVMIEDFPKFDRNLDNVAVPKKDIIEYARKLEHLMKNTANLDEIAENDMDLPFLTYDVYKHGTKYKLVKIRYNPITLEAKIVDMSERPKHIAGAAVTKQAGRNIHLQKVTVDESSGKLKAITSKVFKP